MPQVAVDVIFIVMLILANGIFALSEIAVVSARKARLQQYIDDGDPRADTALGLAESPSKFLATIQIGITLVGILSGAFGGARIAERIAEYLERFPAIAPYGETIGLVAVVMSITYLSLVVGELVPKQIGLRSPERITLLIARPMSILSSLFAPVVMALNFSTKVCLTVLRIPPSSESSVTEEEIKVLIGQGAETGVFNPAERDMINRVFRLGDLRVRSMVTPRTEIVFLDLADDDTVIRQTILANTHAYYPVIEDDIDHVLGIVKVGDLLAQWLSGGTLDISAALRPPLFMPESAPALKVFQLIRDTSSPMVLVIDEYGGVFGLVTIGSFWEQIITDAFLSLRSEPMVIQRADQSWLLDGLLPVDELKALLDIEDFPMEDAHNCQTLGGVVITQLGRIPNTGDHFVLEHWRFEIVDMDEHRVDKVLVEALPEGLEPEPHTQ